MSFSQGLMDVVKFCNRFYTSGSANVCKPFLVEGKQIGILLPNVIEHMRNHPDTFIVNSDGKNDVSSVELAPTFNTYDKRSERLATIINSWREQNLFPATFKTWRNECMNAWHKFSEPPLLKVERCTTSIFGIKQYGTHINGYLNHPEKGLCMWIGTRSKTKPTWPSKLDQMAAGGLADTDDILGCAKRECQEEASVPDELLEKLKPVGTVSYFFEDERGLFPETEFVYDLEVPLDFEPINADGEAEKFTLMTLEEVKNVMVTDKFKFNCALVVIDFMIRHGLLTPDNEPNYPYLVEGMHVKLY